MDRRAHRVAFIALLFAATCAARDAAPAPLRATLRAVTGLIGVDTTQPAPAAIASTIGTRG